MLRYFHIIIDLNFPACQNLLYLAKMETNQYEKVIYTEIDHVDAFVTASPASTKSINFSENTPTLVIRWSKDSQSELSTSIESSFSSGW